MIRRPVNNMVDAHFFSKEGTTHTPDDLHYLISSKGNRSDIPLAKSCSNFNGVDDEVAFSKIGNAGGWTMGFFIYITEATSQAIFFDGATITLGLNQGAQTITVTNGANVVNINQNGQSLKLNIWQSIILVGDSDLLIYIDGILAGSANTSNSLYIDKIAPTENIKLYEFFYYSGLIVNADTVLDLSKFIYRYPLTIQYHFEEKSWNTIYNSVSNTSHGTITGNLTNFWYQGADVPSSFANKLGYSIGANSEIVPALNKTTDALGNPLFKVGQVRHRAKVNNVNIGVMDGTNSIQFSPFLSGFLFTYEGTATSVSIDGSGLLTSDAGTLYDFKIHNGFNLINHYPFNDGIGMVINDIVGSNNGTWLNHIDPNQWGKSDNAIDYQLLNSTKKLIETDSEIDFNPYLALAEETPRSYKHKGLKSTNMFLNNVKRQPSEFDFLFYTSNSLDAEKLRRINDYAQYIKTGFPYTFPFNLA